MQGIKKKRKLQPTIPKKRRKQPMPNDNKTPNRSSTPKFTKKPVTPNDKIPEREEKSNEVKTPKIPLFTFAKSKNYSRPSTAIHTSPHQPSDVKPTSHKQLQQPKSSPLKRNNYNSFPHSNLEKISNSKLLSLLRSKTSAGRIESNNPSHDASRSLASFEQTAFSRHAQQQTSTFNSKPVRTIVPISTSQTNNSFLSGVKSLLSEEKIRDYSKEILGINLANEQPVLEKPLKKGSADIGASVISLTKDKSIRKDTVEEKKEEKLNIGKNFAHSDSLSVPKVSAGDSGISPEESKTRSPGIAKPNAIQTEVYGINEESTNERLEINQEKPVKLDENSANSTVASALDTNGTSATTETLTSKKIVPSPKKFAIDQDKITLHDEKTLAPSKHQPITSEQKMKEDADLKRMEILKSPHLSKSPADRPQGRRNSRNFSTRDEETTKLAFLVEYEGQENNYNSTSRSTEKKNDMNTSAKNKNGENKKIGKRPPEIMSTEAHVNKVTEETTKQIQSVRIDGRKVLQKVQGESHIDSRNNTLNVTPSKRPQLGEIPNPMKKHKPNEGRTPNISNGTINIQKKLEPKEIVRDILHTKESSNEAKKTIQNPLNKSQNTALPSTHKVTQKKDIKIGTNDLFQVESAPKISSEIDRENVKSKDEPVSKAVESKSLLNLFSNILKAPFIKSESKPFSSDALSKEKANFLETIASTEKPENKTDKVSLSQPVSASKHEYSDNFPVSLSQPSKKSFANHTEDEQIEKKKICRGRMNTIITHPGKMELVYVSDSDDSSSDNDSLTDLESLSSGESNEIKVTNDLDTSAEKDQIQAGKWFDPVLDWRKSDRELTKNILWRIADKTTYDKETITDLIEQGIPKHSYLSGNPLTSVTNDICSVENYETSSAFFYQQVHKKDRLQYLPLYAVSTFENTNNTEKNDVTNKNINIGKHSQEQNSSSAKPSQIPTVSSPLGFEETKQSTTPTKSNRRVSHSDTNSSKPKNTKENLSKSSWRQEWLANLKLISVSLVDEFPSELSNSDRQIINEKMQLLKDIFANNFKSAISNNFRESDIIILKGEIEDYPMSSEIKIYYNELQNKPDAKKARFWSFMKTQRFVSNMGFDIQKSCEPVSISTSVKPHVVEPEHMADAKIMPKDILQITKKPLMVKNVKPSSPPDVKSLVQLSTMETKTLPEKKQFDSIFNSNKAKIIPGNGKHASENISLSFSRPASYGYFSVGKRVPIVEDRRVKQLDDITDSNTTEILTSVDVLGTHSQTGTQQSNMYTSTQKTELEIDNKDSVTECSKDMKEDGLSFVDIVLSKAASALDEKEKQLAVANEIIRSLSDEVMRNEIRITSLQGDLTFTKKCLENARSQISEKDAKINKLMEKDFQVNKEIKPY